MLSFTGDIERKDMDGSFSFLNNNEYLFELEGRVQGCIACLNRQMAQIYFVSGLEEVFAPLEIQVKGVTLKEFAHMIPWPPNNKAILMWTSDHEIHHKGRVLVKLKMQRQYSCQAFVCAVGGSKAVTVDAPRTCGHSWL
jgi:hypothetical protein